MKIEFAGPSITDLERKYVLDAMQDSGWHGENKYKYVELFEKEFAKYIDRKYCLMTPNCTSAIYLTLKALGVKEGDEVIVPDLTWVATAFPASELGAKVVFADVLENTWCIDPDNVIERITDKTKVIIAVNLYGNMCNFARLEKIASQYGIILLEDSAESLGSSYYNKKSGTFGLASFFSFHRTKTLTAGEGGVLVTDNQKLYEKCLMLRDLGRGKSTKEYFNEMITLKFMPANLNASLLYAQLLRVNEIIDKKRRILHYYKKNLDTIKGLTLNGDTLTSKNGGWVTAMIWDDAYDISKEDVLDHLSSKDISARTFFYPLSSIPAYNQREQYEDYNLVSYDISKRGINLPCSLNLTKSQIEYICDVIKDIFTAGS